MLAEARREEGQEGGLRECVGLIGAAITRPRVKPGPRTTRATPTYNLRVPDESRSRRPWALSTAESRSIGLPPPPPLSPLPPCRFRAESYAAIVHAFAGRVPFGLMPARRPTSS